MKEPEMKLKGAIYWAADQEAWGLYVIDPNQIGYVVDPVHFPDQDEAKRERDRIDSEHEGIGWYFWPAT
jgi:hypothetical protein